MSLSEMYRSISEKPRTADDVQNLQKPRTVVFVEHLNEVKTALDRIDATLNKLKEEMSSLSVRLAGQEQLDMNSFVDKHNRMKSNYNDFVTAYNITKNDTQGVILELTKRLYECESLLGLK